MTGKEIDQVIFSKNTPKFNINRRRINYKHIKPKRQQGEENQLKLKFARMRMYRKSFRTTYLMGASKIKDGLFLGDEFSVRDFEFQDVNKITRIINCSGKQIANRNNKMIKFLTFNWVETDKQVLFDAEGNNLKQIREFINEGEVNGDGMLIHSVKGVNRSACALIAYFMSEYKWSLAKSIEYLTIRRPNIKIQQSFMAQLQSLEQKLKETQEGATSEDWNEIQTINEQEQIVRNTYLNSKTTATSQVIKRKIFNLNQMKKENIKLRWADHQPGGKLTQLFGVQHRKNFKISTVNFSSPTKLGGKGMASAYSQTAHNFYQSSQQQTQKDRLQETQNDNITSVAPEKSNVKKTYIQSILKGSKQCFDKSSGKILSNGEETEVQSKINIDAVPSPTKLQTETQNNSNIQSNSILQDISNNTEETSEMTQSLSPQKISKNEQNRRLLEANPMSLSDQFNKPQQEQPQLMKNIFKLQQHQIKNTSLIKDTSDQVNVRSIGSNQTNLPKNTLENVYMNYSSNQTSVNSNQQSPTKLVKTLNVPIRVSNLITQESPDGQQNDIPEEDISNQNSSNAKPAPNVSNFSIQYNRTYNFKRQNQEKQNSIAGNVNTVNIQEIQNIRLSEIQQVDINQNQNVKTNPAGSITNSDLLTSNPTELANQQNALPQNQPTFTSANSSAQPKGLMSYKVVVLPKNNQNIQYSEGSLRPNTASNIIQENNRHPELLEDTKFNTQRVTDYPNGSNNGMNVFKVATISVEGNRSVYGNRVRPSSMDQQNRIFRQLNKKQLTNKMNGSLINSNGVSKLNKGSVNGQGGNNSISMNPSSINNYVNNNSNIVKQTQYQYKQAVQTYINANSVNQLSIHNSMIDSNLFKKRIK